MSVPRFTGAILALSCLVAGCTPDEEGPLLMPAAVIPTSAPSKDVGGAIRPDPGVTPKPGETPAPAPIAVLPGSYSLAVPPSGSESPLFETSKTFVVDPVDASTTTQWSSSQTQVAQVDAKGRVTALRPGTAIITASRDGREATASVIVEAKGRLTLRPTGLPTGASILARLYGADGTLLATSEGGKFERSSAGSLSAEIEARIAGRLVALGRSEGMTLHANQVTTCEVPLNAPSLSTAEVSGGPGASVVLMGTRLGGWVKQSYGRLVPWTPNLAATVEGKPATATPVGDGTSVRLAVPVSLDGTGALRGLRLTIEGIHLDATYRLLDSLQFETPALTVPLAGRARFVASATDTSGQTVTSPSLTWAVRPKDQGPGADDQLVGGIDEAGYFMAFRAGEGVIVARSGTLEATASVTVTAHMEGVSP